MAKERFLTVGWNNVLTVGLGIPTIAYGVVALATGVLSDFWGFVGMVVLGVVY
jgi:hypothetical protein